MLEINNLSHVVPGKNKEPLRVLEQVSFMAPGGHVLAVIGPSGSGKTTLLRILAGLTEPEGGTITLRSRDLLKQPLYPNQLGWVPSGDDNLIEHLTVRENLISAALLRGAGRTRDELLSRVSHVLVTVGLENIATERTSTLALPQRRRLKLGLALVADPVIVLCDDFTVGLDVRSEREFEALLKLVASDRPDRIVVHATDSLANLAAYDTVVVLHEGYVAFHGPARAIPHYFTVPTYDEVYARLAKRPAQRWGDSWMKHRDAYYAAFKLGGAAESLSAAEEDPDDADRTIVMKQKSEEEATPKKTDEAEVKPIIPLPGLFGQAQHLVKRRWSLLRRSPREWIVHASLLAGGPAIAALLLWPNKKLIKEAAGGVTTPEVLWPASHTVSMITLLQVLLVMFMALRLGAREIAARRAIYERERVGGVSPAAWLLGTLLFMLPIILVQGVWMEMFLDIVSGGLPGAGLAKLLLPALSGAAFLALCLGISANSSTSERAHSVSLTLLSINVLLCGALLGFPTALGHVVHPFITAHYGWSGIIDSLQKTPFFEPIDLFVKTWFAAPNLAMIMLGVHFLVGVVMAYVGLRRRA
ncbi:MAG: ATP-binding cassette domain-containing protein [Prosthecobacter sp.]|uniref:ATP-binding cassette domain-containing protein n=1 Tax=Prosthecobacter sp. TaxID=1965333 RepID=UPI0019E26134|nr:ATP-binding cassette domain-containing protein [Prosthecobacter sp.]MBE2283419.1 ATP-binding cassette domain-containing protein [Prosthecobacter sp.]